MEYYNKLKRELDKHKEALERLKGADSHEAFEHKKWIAKLNCLLAVTPTVSNPDNRYRVDYYV